MNLAKKARTWINTQLPPIAPSWPYEDRVLLWLVPGLVEDVLPFHEGTGPTMEELLSPQGLRHLDRDLYRNLRVRILRAAAATGKLR